MNIPSLTLPQASMKARVASPQRSVPEAAARFGAKPDISKARHLIDIQAMPEYKFINAAKTGDKGKVEKFLAEGMDPNIQDYLGESAMMFATLQGHADVVATFVKHPATDVNLADDNGLTAIFYGAYRHRHDRPQVLSARLDALRPLLNDVRTNVNYKNSAGDTVLHYAVKNNVPDVVKALLSRPDLNVNEKDVNGNTALHLAVDTDSTEITRLLINDKRVKVSLENDDGNTPLRLACKVGRDELFNLVCEGMGTTFRLKPKTLSFNFSNPEPGTSETSMFKSIKTQLKPALDYANRLIQQLRERFRLH